LFASSPVWIAKTVLLETVWVLRASYGYDERTTREAIVRLLGARHISVEDPSGVAAALTLAAEGVAIADAIHLMSIPRGIRFLSFDKSLVKRASRAGVSDVADAATR